MDSTRVPEWPKLTKRLSSIISILAVLAVSTASAELSSTARPTPRLIVQVTIDQLRGDMLPRFHDRFGPNGFRRLTDHGLYFTAAHYGTGNTFTASGHAVLATGADTAEHGMVANEWFDRVSGKLMYSTFDAQHGMSPGNLTSTTFADELIVAMGNRSRAFAIAGKDRSAIIPGGHLGKAFWFSESTGGFVSSTYYFPALPAWVQNWNDEKRVERFKSQAWTLLREISTYRNAAQRDNTYARPNAMLGRTFPHKLAADSDKAFLSALRMTPFLDEHTLSFARELVTRERLGKAGNTDYLSISLSGTDYIGHSYGPNSLEYEDNLLRLDANFASFLSFLDRAVGADRVLIVLSADHGVDDIPEAHRATGYDADRFHPKRILDEVNTVLKKRLGVTENLVMAFAPPGLYLDRALVDSAKLDFARVEAALAAEMRALPGVAYAFTRSDLLAGRIAHTPLLNKVQRSFHPTRSGDVIIVQQQFWYLYHDPEGFAAMHGSPYSYDTFVPVIFYGAGIPARIISRPIEPGSIAPTLAARLRIKPPSGNAAIVLPEALDGPSAVATR